MKRNLRRKAILLFSILLALSTWLAACSSTKNNPASATQTPALSTTAASAAPKAMDPNAKYDPPIDVSEEFTVSGAIADKFTEDSLKNHPINQAYLNELGIKLDFKWIAKGDDQANQKKSVAIASGDLPDILTVNKEQLATLSKTDLINKNMAAIYEQYATPLTKEIMHQEGNAAFDSATFKGKLIAIPDTNSTGDNAYFMYIRNDWLKKLGLQPPKNMDELYNVMKAFVELDPDGNGKKDTVGLLLNKDFLLSPEQGFAQAQGIFNGFHAYPQIWVKDASGKLVYGSTQPQMKDALKYLAKLYKDGLIETDFGAKDSTKVAELAGANRVGVNFGAMWNPMFPFQTTKDNFPDSDWEAYPLISADAQPALTQVRLAVDQYYVVRNDFAHPEALIKMLNWWTEKTFGKSVSAEEHDRLFSNNGHHYTNVKSSPAKKNLTAHLKIMDALNSKDPSKLSIEEKGYYDNILKYNAGDNKNWQYEKVFGPTGSYKIMEDYYKNNSFKMDEFIGATTETMKSKLGIIQKTEMEYYTKVIMGSESIDHFGAFVDKLNKLGLDQITNEVNDWSKKK